MAERVYIRPVSRRDRSEFLHFTQQSQHVHEPWITPPLSDATFHSYLKRTEQNDHEGLLVCLRDNDAIVGVININNIVRGSFLSASLGYYVSAAHIGQGYMREGLELVKTYAFCNLGLHRLEANIQPENTPSIGLVKSCGFELEGLSRSFLFIAGAWRDHERWTALHPRATLLP